jgi:hypothetical protein
MLQIVSKRTYAFLTATVQREKTYGLLSANELAEGNGNYYH